jgi:hypothetical protein
MTAMDVTLEHRAAVAGILLARLSDADFVGLADAFESPLDALAMLPAGVFRWPDPATVTSVFEQWFGGVDEFRLTDFAVSHLGRRLHVRWRILVSGGGFGADRHVVEQQVYADTGPSGRIASMSLLCSGFIREQRRG